LTISRLRIFKNPFAPKQVMADMTDTYQYIQQFVTHEHNAHDDLRRVVDSSKNKSLAKRMVEDVRAMSTCCHGLVQTSKALCSLSEADLREIATLKGGRELSNLQYMLKSDYGIHHPNFGMSRASDWTSLVKCAGGQFRRAEQGRYEIESMLRIMRGDKAHHAYESAVELIKNLGQLTELSERMVRYLEKLADEEAGTHGIIFKEDWRGFNAHAWKTQNIRI
jgi:hypothetical protein